MTPQEEYRWRVFDLIEPIGDVRADHMAAMICSFIAGKSIDAPNWGSGLRRFLPEDEKVKERLRAAQEMLGFFDSDVKPNPDRKPPRPPTPPPTADSPPQPRRKVATIPKPPGIPTQI